MIHAQNIVNHDPSNLIDVHQSWEHLLRKPIRALFEVPIQEPLMFTFEDQDVKGQSPFEDQDMQLPDDTNASQQGLPGIFPKVWCPPFPCYTIDQTTQWQ